MPQVVNSENLIEFVQTGKAPQFKPPAAPGPDRPVAPPINGTDASVPASPSAAPAPTPKEPVRDASGKFTKPPEGDKTTPAAASSDKDEDGEADLPEVVRRKIDKKHRQLKEAEEFAKSEWRRAHEAEQRAEQLEQRLKAFEKSGPASEPKAPKEPKPEDFTTVGEYTDALVTYRVDQRLREEKAKVEREAEQREREAREREFGKRMSEARAKHDDFEEVLRSIKGTDLERVHMDVVEYIQESDHGPDLLYHLAKNPDVLDRLRKLSPRRFVAELGKLEAKWEVPAAPAAKDETPTLSQVATPTATPVSKAPAPIAPLNTAGVAPVAKKPEDMSVQELREYRRQQERQKRAS